MDYHVEQSTNIIGINLPTWNLTLESVALFLLRVFTITVPATVEWGWTVTESLSGLASSTTGLGALGPVSPGTPGTRHRTCEESIAEMNGITFFHTLVVVTDSGLWIFPCTVLSTIDWSRRVAAPDFFFHSSSTGPRTVGPALPGTPGTIHWTGLPRTDSLNCLFLQIHNFFGVVLRSIRSGNSQSTTKIERSYSLT